jgi:hypothetical protein
MLVHDVKVAAISLGAAFFSVEFVVAPLCAVKSPLLPHDDFARREDNHNEGCERGPKRRDSSKQERQHSIVIGAVIFNSHARPA